MYCVPQQVYIYTGSSFPLYIGRSIVTPLYCPYQEFIRTESIEPRIIHCVLRMNTIGKVT